MIHFRGKRVVVTGAGGSIGSEICRRLVDEGVAELTLVGLTENKLYDIHKELSNIKGRPELVPVLGSVGNTSIVYEALAGKDIVIHAGAHKHVPLCEQNPLEAIQNNVFGTEHLINAAIEEKVSQFLLVSTDKAVNPKSVMGATKRVCELLVTRAAHRCPDSDFVSVRFGNVLNSSGSVLPLWREQIAKGGPITLTDRRCTRYFMEIPEAVELVLNVLAMGFQSGTFVFDMGEPRSMYEMAQQLIVSTGLPCEIREIGLRPGEKLTEELYEGSKLYDTQHPRIKETPGGGVPKVALSALEQLRRATLAGLDRRAVDILMEMVK